jgi:hypothetical protein
MEGPGAAAKQQCDAIRALAKAAPALSPKQIKSRLRKEGAKVLWTKQLRNSHYVNVALVTEEHLAQILSKYGSAPSAAPSVVASLPNPTILPSTKQNKLSFDTPKNDVASLVQRVQEARALLKARIDEEIRLMSNPVRQLEIEEVLKDEKLTNLDPSRVGAKAALIFKAHFPGREIGKRTKVLRCGKSVPVRNWTAADYKFIKLAAHAVALATATCGV